MSSSDGCIFQRDVLSGSDRCFYQRMKRFVSFGGCYSQQNVQSGCSDG